jgi:hypothetical protein
MKQSVSALAALMCGALLLAAPMAQAAAPAVQLVSPGNTFDNAVDGTFYTLGFQFEVTVPVKVVALGVFDNARDGLEAAADVALWLDADGTVLSSAVVPNGTAATLDGYFRQVAVTPVLLTPGTLYVVGAALNGGLATSLGIGEGSVGSFDARLTGIVDRSWDAGFDFPLGSDGQPGAWLGANFQLAPVPEPASAGLLAAGLLALAWRRKSQRG